MVHLTEKEILDLERRARLLRADILRMITRRGAGHPGGSLSSAEIMAVLMFRVMRIDPARPDWPERDRLILSKGHASALLYAALAQRGFFPPGDLSHWGELDCHLQGHPDRLKTPGVEMSSGILGHGIAVASGLALAARLQKMNYRIYVILGDGECQGGIVWEGAAVAAKYRLCNITAILDYNDVQLDGPVHEIMPVESVAERWKSFGWQVIEINGHDVCQVVGALETAHEIHNKPTIIVAHTTKGKGVPFMENESYWHGVAPNAEQLSQALADLGVEGED
jgi:transketolase